MKTKILTYITIATAILFTSCEKEIEFNGEQNDSKLVINSIVEPGQPVSAAISKSFFFLDNTANTIAPEDLVATLYVNGNRRGEMTPHFDTIVSYDIWEPNNPNLGHIRKIYTYDYCPAVGDVIKITASASGFDDVVAITQPLPKAVDCQANVEITDWRSYYQPTYYYDHEEQDYIEDSLLSFFGTLVLRIDITDPNPGQIDYFKIDISSGFSTLLSSCRCYFEYDDPIFGSVLPNNEFVDFSELETRPKNVFTDMLFDGKSYQLKVKMKIEVALEDGADTDFFQLPIRLEHITKEYYNYLNTCDQGDEMDLQILTEPIHTYTNVDGGYGIVGGRLVDKIWYALPLSE